MSDENTSAEKPKATRKHRPHTRPNRKVNPKSLANLIPIKKGQKMSPGRPKGSVNLKDRLQKFLDLDVKIKMPDGSIQDKTVLDNILMSLLAQAAKGNVKAIQEVLDRQYGKADQKLEISGNDGKPVQVEHSARLSEIYERASKAFDSRSGILDATPASQRSISADDSGSSKS